MAQPKHSCLILACGNTLRSDDGVGPWLAAWAQERFHDEPGVKVVSRHQWTPELAQDVASAESVLFIDCSAGSAPGAVRLVPVETATETQALATHHLSAAQLLALGRKLYDSLPANALQLTVGAGSTELGEEFSRPVLDALASACAKIEETVTRLLSGLDPGIAPRE
jgi:hydrogenase maturation protease